MPTSDTLTPSESLMPNVALSIAATKLVIDTSWSTFLRTCEGAFCREIRDLVDLEASAERQHRSSRERFGLSVNYAARLMALKHVLEAPTGSVKWEDVGSYAPRVLAAYALGARLRTTKLHHSKPAVFEGETYMDRLVGALAQAVVEKLSRADVARLHDRRAPTDMDKPVNLPLVCCVDYVRDIVRGK